MGHRKVPTIYTITDVKGLEGAVIRLKSIKVGKLRRLLAALESDADFSTVMTPIFTMVAEALVSWDLEDENGTPLPATLEGIEELELADIMGIISAWTERMTGVDPDLGKDSPSGEPSLELSGLMEAL